MSKEETPAFILPKKRNGKKQGSITGHVDHIITVQGGADEVPIKYKNGLSPVTEHEGNTIHSSVEGLKYSLKMNLPIIHDDEDLNDANTEDTEKHYMQKNCYQALSTNNSREGNDLSPIYENSSDACSSHSDLREADNELHSSCKELITEEIESVSTATVNLLDIKPNLELEGLCNSIKRSAKRKMKESVNIQPESAFFESGNTDSTDDEITALRNETLETFSSGNSKDGYVTMSGTIKRGKNKGLNVDIKLNISREELDMFEASIIAEEYNKMNIFGCSLYHGLHIFIFTLLCMPFIALVSCLYSFYLGTKTWCNVFGYIIQLPFCTKLILTPIVILLYPFLNIIFSIGIGLYAGIVQLRFSGINWRLEVRDFEKGFYGWFCNAIGMTFCSPYEVVVLTAT